MAIRIRYKTTVTLSSTTAEERDLGNISTEVVADSQNEGGAYKLKLAAATTNRQIALDDLATVRLLMIRTNAVDPNQIPVPITIRRETTSGEAIIIQPLPTTKEGILVLTTEGLTALFATNAGTVDMEMTIGVAGD